MKPFYYFVRTIMICSLCVGLSGCDFIGWVTGPFTKPIGEGIAGPVATVAADIVAKAVAVIDQGINDIDTNSAEWQTVFQRVANDLPKEISEEIQTDAQNLATRSIATVGTEFRCNVDFLKNRAVQNLRHLEAKLLGEKPSPLSPEFCQVSPAGIELATDPAHWAQVSLYGYDLDYTDTTKSLFQVLLQNEQGQTTVLPENRIGRTTHYQVTLNLGNMARDFYNNKTVKILVSWNKSTDRLPQVVVVPWTPRQEPDLHLHPGKSNYTPPHTVGDSDFDTDSDSPTSVYLKGEIRVTGQDIFGRVYMKARESEPDHTTVEGQSSWYTFYSAPAGWKITSVRPTAASEVKAQLTDHGTPVYFTPAGEVVNNFKVWGDREGDEAGTYTAVEVTWQDLTYTIEEIAPSWLR